MADRGVAEPACGTGPCREMVDRLGKMMTDQQAEGFRQIRELMTVHHMSLKDDVTELRAAHKFQGDEVFPRLRRVEEKIAVIESTDISEEKVRQLVTDNETVTWTARRRSFERAISVPILVIIIVGILTAARAIYVDYQNNTKTVTAVQAGK